ncbi:sporulation histidine kinase inhibitor Sda [Sporosarcina sp. FSL W8-0480]|uniref:sporulation histidine kinase inhibitor Sda n=1 Tax=Sporosarcina sp. FSL W8-0480 TaxID=2954701 RepID=UPI0030DBD11F
MSRMSDELLVEAYEQAVVLNLCPGFILLLEKEIQRRSLQLDIEHCESTLKSSSFQ